MKIIIVIPAYNEESTVERVIQEIRMLKKNYGVVVIDDCSTDRTRENACRSGATVLSLPMNLGIGAAVQTGFKYALRENYDVAVQVDGDGQHPPSEIPKLINAMEKLRADVVIGSRFLEKKGFQSTFGRRMGISYFRFLHNILTRVDVADCTSGFRALNQKALKIVNEYYPDEYPEAESIVLFASHRLKILEIPVVMRERLGGQSSIKTASAVYYIFKVSLAIFFTFLRLRKGEKHARYHSS